MAVKQYFFCRRRFAGARCPFIVFFFCNGVRVVRGVGRSTSTIHTYDEPALVDISYIAENDAKGLQ